MAGDPTARFVIAVDTSGGVASSAALGGALEQLKGKIAQGTKALTDLQGAAARLKNAADVVKFEGLGKDLHRAQADAEKLESKLVGLRAKLEGTTNVKAGQALKSQIGQVEGALAAARGKASAIGAAREKLGQSEAVKAYKDVTAAIKDKQSALAGAQTEVSRLGGSLTDSAGAAEEAGGAMGFLGGKIKSFAALGPAGIIAAIAAVVIGLGVAAARTAIQFGAFVIAMSEAGRSAKIFADATARSEAGGTALLKSVNAVYQRVGGDRSVIGQLALDMRRLGLEGAALENSLEAISATTRVFGSSAGGAIQGLIDKAALVRRGVLQPLELRGTGLAFADVASAVAKNFKISMGVAGAALRNGQLRVEDFTRALRDAARVRTGAALEAMALGLDEQFRHLHDNIAQIFKLDDTKFLKGLRSVLSLLDESTESGKALRSLARTLLQPLLDASERVFPILRAFMLGAILGVIEFSIALLRAALFVKNLLPPGFAKNIDAAKVAFYAGAVAAFALLVVAAALAGTILTLIGMMVAFAAVLALPLVLIGAIVYGIGKLLDLVGKDGAGKGAGSRIVDGIIAGIKGKTSELLSNITGLGPLMSTAFDKGIDAHSPSRLFAARAENITEGVEVGVERGAPGVASAIGSLASPDSLQVTAGAAPGAGTPPGGGAREVSVYIDARGSSPQQVQSNRALGQSLVEVLEEALRQAGGSVARIGVTT